MNIETNDINGILVVKPQEKRIDSANAPGFKNRMVDFILEDNTKIALDLSEIDFMDSSGLSALLSTFKTISKQGRMVLFGVGSNVGKLFSITRLDKGIFEIHPDLQSALRSLNQTG